ncbi:MAG: hypothetical protein IPM61_08545 [Chlorobi bacterium]|nr:hypothetical protein [Chlorobiota bacterium]
MRSSSTVFRSIGVAVGVFFAAIAATAQPPGFHPMTDQYGHMGIGTIAPDKSAILDLSTTTAGFLMPRLTNAERNAIANPATGLMIFNSDTKTMEFQIGTTFAPIWNPVLTVATGAGMFWGLTGNAGTTAGTNFVGTTDNVAFEVRVNNSGAVTGGNRRVMRFEPNATSANIIGGFNGNLVATGAVGGVIAGGGANAATNRVTDDYGAILGGQNNRAGNNTGTTADTPFATVVGGSGNVASGSFATAMGSNTTASGDTATAIGSHTVASGENSFASGYQSIASGWLATAMGDSAVASAYAATAFGSRTVASGFYSTAMGVAATASGHFSTAVGTGTTAGGQSSIAMGLGLTLDASAARSFGYHANNVFGGLPMVISTPDVAVFGNADLWLANNDNAPSELRFFEGYNAAGEFPNTANYTAFKAQNQTSDITYTLPAVAPASDNRILTSTATGTMSWGRKITKATVTQDIASVAAGAQGIETFTVTGAGVGGSVVISPSANLTAGLVIGFARVSAANTVTVSFQNVSGGAIDEGSLEWGITVVE